MRTNPIGYTIPYEGVSRPLRFDEAISQFDAIGLQDPKTLSYAGESWPAEFLLAQALCQRVIQLNPNASEALLLASRCQHLGRWKRPRHTFPSGRQGYLDWRAQLKTYHADLAAGILRECGYGPRILSTVRSLNLKENIKGCAACQAIEDALCLVFLQFQFDDIIARYPEGKVLAILRKTARKMSPAGLDAAGKMPHSPAASTLLSKLLDQGLKTAPEPFHDNVQDS